MFDKLKQRWERSKQRTAEADATTVAKVSKKRIGAICMALAVAAISCVSAFATDVASFSITSSTVDPIVNAINSGLTTLVPIGIGIMATFIGVHLIRRVIYMFL